MPGQLGNTLYCMSAAQKICLSRRPPIVVVHSGYSGRGDTASEEARNMNYEGSTASGARSGATGSTSALAGQNTGSNSGYQSGNTGNTSSNTGYQSGSGVGSGAGVGSGLTGNRGTTGTTSTTTTTTGNRGVGTGITEGFAGLNITHRSGVRS